MNITKKDAAQYLKGGAGPNSFTYFDMGAGSANPDGKVTKADLHNLASVYGKEAALTEAGTTTVAVARFVLDHFDEFASDKAGITHQDLDKVLGG